MSEARKDRTFYILAVEDQELIHFLGQLFVQHAVPYEVVAPDQLPLREYHERYIILLESSAGLERMKQIAAQVCHRWGRKDEGRYDLDNFFWIYFISNKSTFRDQDLFDFWMVAGWDASLVLSYGSIEEEQNIRSFMNRILGTETPEQCMGE